MFDFFGLTNEQLNLLENTNIPANIYKTDNVAYKFWFRSLLQKIDSSIVFENLPDGWSNDYLMFCLWLRGFVGVFESNIRKFEKYGNAGNRNILFTACNIAGLDFYYQPTTATMINPVYTKTEVFEVNKDIFLLKLCPDFRGCFDILHYYADKLATISAGLDMGFTNAKTPMILTASSEGQAATLKKIYDKVQAGQSLIVWDDLNDNDEIMPRKEPFEFWNQDFRQTYLCTTLLQDMSTLLNQFYQEIGIPICIDKKERLVTTEADFSIAQSQARISCWAETLKESLDIINKQFGLQIGVSYASENNDNRDGKLSESDGEQIDR